MKIFTLTLGLLLSFLQPSIAETPEPAQPVTFTFQWDGANPLPQPNGYVWECRGGNAKHSCPPD